MKVKLLAGVLLLAAASVASAAEAENPYKKAKVGDYATYTMTTKVAGTSFEGTITQTVVAKDDKEATVKTSGKVNAMGMEIPIPEQEQKIDLTKPYDPTTAGNLPPGAQVKVEKLKDGKEKIKLGKKEYDATWQTYKMKANAMGMEFEAEMKVWQSDSVSLPMIKMEMTAEVGGMKTEVVMELAETGHKEPEKK